MRSPWCASHLRLGPEEPPETSALMDALGPRHTRACEHGGLDPNSGWLSPSYALALGAVRGTNWETAAVVSSLRAPLRPVQAQDATALSAVSCVDCSRPGQGLAPQAAEPSLLVPTRLPGTAQPFGPSAFHRERGQAKSWRLPFGQAREDHSHYKCQRPECSRSLAASGSFLQVPCD